LVPIYGTMGAGISILATYLGSSLLLIILTNHDSFRYIIFTCLSILAGFTMDYIISLMIGNEQQLLIVISSVVTSILIIPASKNMTIREVKYIAKGILHKK
jgi:hypothetical protein